MYLTPSSLCFPTPHTSPLICSLWICLSFVPFTVLLCFLDSTSKRYHTVFVFPCLISFSILPPKPSVMLQMAHTSWGSLPALCWAGLQVCGVQGHSVYGVRTEGRLAVPSHISLYFLSCPFLSCRKPQFFIQKFLLSPTPPAAGWDGALTHGSPGPANKKSRTTASLPDALPENNLTRFCPTN